MNSQTITFQNSRGQAISARLDKPEGRDPLVYAVFAHCFTCTKNFKAPVQINRALANEGIASLRFDFTGLGESEGDFAETNFSTNVADLVSAAEYLSRRFQAPRLMIGHSLGGAAVIRAAEQIPSCVAVATIAAPADTAHVVRALQSTREEIERRGVAEIKLAGRSFKITRQFMEDLERTRMRESIANLRRALLIFHSPEDPIVGIQNAYQIFEAARNPKSFISLDGADHLLSRRQDSAYVGSVLAAWLRRSVGV